MGGRKHINEGCACLKTVTNMVPGALLSYLVRISSMFGRDSDIGDPLGSFGGLKSRRLTYKPCYKIFYRVLY